MRKTFELEVIKGFVNEQLANDGNNIIISLRAISDFFVCGGWEETPHAYEGDGERTPRSREGF